MKLLDEKLIKRFQEVWDQLKTRNPLVITRFYTLFNSWEWYVSEYYPLADTFYWYKVIDWFWKWCYFKLPEIEWVNEFQIKRDLDFVPSFFESLKI